MRRPASPQLTRSFPKTPSRRRARRLGLERLDTRLLLAGDLTNEANPLDVNADESITASDALAIINHVSRQHQRAEGEERPTLMYMDVNADGNVTIGDALRVINGLNRAESQSLPLESDDAFDSSENGSSDNGASHLDVERRGRDVHIRFRGRDDRLTLWSPQPGMLRIQHGLGATRDVPLGNDLHIHASGQGLDVILGRSIDNGVEDETPDPENDLETEVSVAETARRAEGEDTNGTSSGFIGVNIPDDLYVKFSGNGNDFVMRASHVHDDLIFRGSSGADSIDIGMASVVDDLVHLLTRDGDDQVRLGGGIPVVATTAEGEEANGDTRGARFGDDVLIDLGDGDDSLSFESVEIHDDAKVIAGEGNDSITHERLRIRDDYILYGQDGRDSVRAEDVSVGDDAIVKMGDDDDFVELSSIRVGDVGLLDGGDDFDSLGTIESTIDVAKLRIIRFESVGGIGDDDDD